MSCHRICFAHPPLHTSFLPPLPPFPFSPSFASVHLWIHSDARYTGQNPETLPLGAPVHWETREEAHHGGSLEAGSSTVFTKELFLAFWRMRISEADASLSKEESASECYHVCFLGPCRTISGGPSSPFPHCWRLWLEQKTPKVGSGMMTLRRERSCREFDGWLLPLVWKPSGP